MPGKRIDHLVLREYESAVSSDDDSKTKRIPVKAFNQIARAQSACEDGALKLGYNKLTATQFVGVIQVPGFTLEILPKIESSETLGSSATARGNLLKMLELGGEVPERERGMADLASHNLPLSELMMALFAGKLLDVLRRASHRSYVTREENLRFFRGRLSTSKHVVANAARADRFLCRFDELLDDTPINQVLRAGVRAVWLMTRVPTTQSSLASCLELLDGVSDIALDDTLLARIRFDRQSRELEPLFRLAVLILRGRSPDLRAGDQTTFSLLFDMNRVFEGFVAALVRRAYAGEGRVHVKHRSRWLEGKGHQGWRTVEPDVLVELGEQRVVIDSKWKNVHKSSGLHNADLYQLHTYAHHFETDRGLLLFPRQGIGGHEHLSYQVKDKSGLTPMHIAAHFLDMSRPLCAPGELAKMVAKVRGWIDGNLATAQH